jgi:hypothetical protein
MYSIFIFIRYNTAKLVNLTTLRTISYAIVFIYFSYPPFCYPSTNIRNRVVNTRKNLRNHVLPVSLLRNVFADRLRNVPLWDPMRARANKCEITVRGTTVPLVWQTTNPVRTNGTFALRSAAVRTFVLGDQGFRNRRLATKLGIRIRPYRNANAMVRFSLRCYNANRTQ